MEDFYYKGLLLENMFLEVLRKKHDKGKVNVYFFFERL